MPGIRQYYAKGRLKAGDLNKTEEAYRQHLEILKRAGEIVWYRFEGIRLILAEGCSYTPDFAVMRPDGMIELHEVKGAKALFRDDARVKVKMAAELFPFKIIVVYPKPRKMGWEMEEF